MATKIICDACGSECGNDVIVVEFGHKRYRKEKIDTLDIQRECCSVKCAEKIIAELKKKHND